MTNIPYASRVDMAVDYLITVLRARAPKLSWNLALNGIRKVWNPALMSWEVWIGGEPAPYAVYTNEPWISEKWHGRQNPHLHWIQQAVEEAKPVIVAMLSGEMTEQDIMTLQGGYIDIIESQRQADIVALGGVTI